MPLPKRDLPAPGTRGPPRIATARRPSARKINDVGPVIRLRHKLLIYALRIFDQVLLASVLGLTVDLFGRYAGGSRLQDILRESYRPGDGIGVALLAAGWIVIFNTFVRYDTNRFRALISQLADVLKATIAAAFLLMIVAAVFAFSRVNTTVLVLFWCGTSVLCVLSRLAIHWILMVARRSGYNYRNLLIVGINTGALQLVRRIDSSPELGFKIAGFISEKAGDSLPEPCGDYRILGALEEVKAILEKGTVDEMMVCLPLEEHFPAIANIVRMARELGIVARFFPDAETAKVLTRLHIEQFEGDCVVTLFREQMLLQLLLKRLIDLFVSSVLLIVLSPLLLAVVLAIKWTSPGPVLFVQERIGMNRRRFRLYKFRSMYADAEKRRRELEHMNEMDGPVFKIKNDPRITPLGRWIRKTSIDELPQLFNVLQGHMSLVGPRPPLLAEVDQYEWLFRKRLSIKPGLTCLWQISGRNEVSFKQWMELDRQYVENWSLGLDLRILLRTIPVVLFGRGAS